MVCEAMGEIQYGDKGNMTKEEIDKTIGIFTEAKKAGQFRAFWKSFDESVNLMASGEVVIQSMWSPAITAVRSKGIPCVYQPLKEGYRSWGGGLGIAAHLSGKELDAAYEYINWYLSGWVGGFLMRQGYYSAAVETSKEYMSADEWGYWFEGKAAKGDIVNPQGVKMESAGAVRDGGSFYDRMGSVACWNAVMDENFLMRQGYYSAAVETSKEYMSADEWGYWFEGKAAKGDIVNPQGVKMESAGAVRDGGSFYDRMGSVACWNAVMDENQYMVRKWNEFIAS